MRTLRNSCLLAAAAVLLVACKGQDETPAQAASQNPLLAYAPANTPYVFANLEPIPRAVVDAYLDRFEPSLALAQEMLDDFRLEVSADAGPAYSHARLVAAVLAELDGKLNREGIESLGLSLESHKAVYGIGAFPVIRIAVDDASALRAALGRIEAGSGMTFPVASLEGVDYWRLTDHGEQAGIYMAILADHFALGVFPAAAEADMLPGFLGLQKPADALDGAELAGLNRANGFTDFGSGYLDLRRIADEMLDANSITMSSLAHLANFDHASLDPVCKAEIRSLVAGAPRMVMGTSELTANRVGVKYQLELDEALAAELVRLVADVPAAEESADKMLTAALGIRAGRLREFLLEKATAWSENPFQCPRMTGLNQAATGALAQMNRPMPPFIGNLNGFRVSVDEIDMDDPSPQSARGVFALEVEKPQMLIGMAQMFVPGVAELGLEPGGEPVALPTELTSMAMAGLQVYAAMSEDAIGLAFGADQQDGLADFMAAAGNDSGTFLSVSYDMARQMEFQAAMRERLLGAEAPGGAEAAEMRDMIERLEALEASYREMLGRTRFDMRFTPAGLEIENVMTFR